jgi:hypothetical protein
MRSSLDVPRLLRWTPLAVLAVLVLPGKGFPVDFTFGIAAPLEVRGAPGEEVTFVVFPTLATSGNPSAEGAQGWSFSLVVDGGEVAEASLDNLQVSTIYYAQEGEPPLDPYLMDLTEADLRFAAEGWDIWTPTIRGVISGVFLNLQKKQVLQPEGTLRIARVTVKATIPAEGTAAPVRFRYVSGLVNEDWHGIDNYVIHGDTSFIPLLEDAAVSLVPVPLPFIRGDANADGQVDISDALDILDELFVAGTGFPCRTAADASADGRVDVTDAIFVLGFLFLDTVKMAAPYPECGTAPGPTLRDCPPGASGCLE